MAPIPTLEGCACCASSGQYRLQIQHPLFVSDADLAHFWVFDGALGLLFPIERDAAAMERIKATWDAFEPCLDTDTPLSLSKADTVAHSGSL